MVSRSLTDPDKLYGTSQGRKGRPRARNWSVHAPALQLVGIKIVVRRLEYDRDINFKQRLFDRVRLLNPPDTHLTDALLCCGVLPPEIFVLQELFSRVCSRVPCLSQPGGLSGR